MVGSGGGDGKRGWQWWGVMGVGGCWWVMVDDDG